jgi:hypothetical protein
MYKPSIYDADTGERLKVGGRSTRILSKSGFKMMVSSEGSGEVTSERKGWYLPERLLAGDKINEGTVISKDKYKVETELGSYPISDLVNEDGLIEVIGTIQPTKVWMQRKYAWSKSSHKVSETFKVGGAYTVRCR